MLSFYIFAETSLHHMNMKFILVLCLLVFLQERNVQSATLPEQKAEAWADSVLQQMSLEEKIGQLFMIAAYSNQTENYENNLEQQLLKYQVGGIIFFQGDPVRQANLIRRYQQKAKYPLMIGLDAEHGIGWRLKSAMEFPKMLIAGAVQNDSLIYALGAAIARHCRETGVHVNFAPVADINSNPQNPVIGMRSFGEDPEQVAQKTILYAKGSISRGVLPVVKHFPGHGDTDTDSHHALPILPHSRQRLDSIELYPYRAIIDARLPAIMTSHLAVKTLDTTNIPASLSPDVIQKVLKKELGFQGLCFTDALNMKGVSQNHTPGEIEVKALLAGNDVLLFPENLEKAIAGIKKAITGNLLHETLINEKCRKILTFKHRYVLPNLLPDNQNLQPRLHTPQDSALQQQLYREAITLIKNETSLIPLKRLDTLQIASIHFGGKKINTFQNYLSRYSKVTHFATDKNLSDEEIRNWGNKLKNYNCIIIYNSAANHSPAKNFGYSITLSKLIRQLAGKKIIFCHPAIPYGLEKYTGLPVDAFLISYDHHPCAQQFMAQAVFGGISIRGKLPVSISPEYPVKTGIRTFKSRLGYLPPEMTCLNHSVLYQIDSLCQLAIRQKATPGCQVLIAKDGNVVYNKAFGYHTYRKEQANTDKDIYDIASVTKITATLPALMKLYDEQQIRLDSPLSSYYPPLEDTDKKDLNLKEILCHNAGLKTFLPLFSNAIDKNSIPGPLFTTCRTPYNTTRLNDRLYVNLNYKFRDSTISHTPKEGYLCLAPGVYVFPSYQDTVLQTILHSPLSEKKTYAYSDLGFILLKFAIENVTGEPLNSYCQKHFYSRLGMNNTGFRAAETLDQSDVIPSCVDKLYRKTELKGYVHDPTAALLGGIAGHAGLFSTAEDLAKILQMYLNQGTYGDEYYLAPETLNTFTEKNTLFPQNRRSFGFDKPEPDSTKIGPTCHNIPLTSYGHTGFTGIMAWCDPDNNLLYLFLSNRTYPDEFNTKLSEENIRTKIQEIIYQALDLKKRTKEQSRPAA